MVDLGPLGPWSGPPDMAVPALERWHAAWERDHPELLGPDGPSFYDTEQQGGRYNPGGIITVALPPLHVDPLLIGDLYGRERKTR